MLEGWALGSRDQVIWSTSQFCRIPFKRASGLKDSHRHRNIQNRLSSNEISADLSEHKPETIFLAFDQFLVYEFQFSVWSDFVDFVFNKFIDSVMWNVVIVLLKQFLLKSKIVIIFLVLSIFRHQQVLMVRNFMRRLQSEDLIVKWQNIFGFGNDFDSFFKSVMIFFKRFRVGNCLHVIN